MIKLYIKEIEVELEEDNIINSFIVLTEEYYKERKDKKEFKEIETNLTFETASAYPEYLVVEDNILKLKNVKELKNYTYKIFLLENEIDIGTNLLIEGYYPIEKTNEMISFRVDEPLNEYDLELLQNKHIIIEDKKISLKQNTVNLFKIKERTNLWEEKENERLTNR
jgi:hypothetical protein